MSINIKTNAVSNPTLIIDLLELSTLINYEIGDYLNQCPSGIYVTGQCDPLIVDGPKYFYQSKKDNKSNQIKLIDSSFTLEDLVNVKSIYNEDMETVYSANKGKTNSLLPIPNVPAMSRNMLRDLIQYFLDTENCWMPYENIVVKKKTLCELWGEYLIGSVTAMYSKEEINDRLRVVHDKCIYLLATLESFIGNNKWMMHSVKIKDFVITIEQTNDYRIFDWHRQQEIKMEKPYADIFETAAAAEGLTITHF